MKQPVSENQIVKLECVNVGAKGDGICKYENFVIIVPGMNQGQIAPVRITRVMDRVGFGEIVV